MRKRLFLFKKQLGAWHSVGGGVFALANRLKNDALFGAIRGISARMGATQSLVIVTYSKTPVNFIDMTGMVIEVEGVDDLAATTPTLDGNEVTYTLTSPAAELETAVVWKYTGGGTIVDGDGEPLQDGTLLAQKKTSPPPVTVDSWATESDGVWNTETDGNWILE
jgi:hypothetical protein